MSEQSLNSVLKRIDGGARRWRKVLYIESGLTLHDKQGDGSDKNFKLTSYSRRLKSCKDSDQITMEMRHFPLFLQDLRI